MELMVTVAIIGILAAVALPSYSTYVIRGKIPEATANLATKQVKMEQLFQDYQSYQPAGVATACDSDTTTSKSFDFSCSAQSATAYTLQAVGKSSMSGFTFTVDQNNVKKTVAVPTGWTLPSTNCWATDKGGSC